MLKDEAHVLSIQREKHWSEMSPKHLTVKRLHIIFKQYKKLKKTITSYTGYVYFRQNFKMFCFENFNTKLPLCFNIYLKYLSEFTKNDLNFV